MPLVNMRSLLAQADQFGYAVGAFNVANMEMVIGTVRAAEESRSPIILQVAQGRLAHAPLALIGPMLLAAARRATVPVAVHLDHGRDVETIGQALELGFTSVMIDGSHLPLADNLVLTRQVKRLADGYGAAVEAEVGQLGGSEDDEAARDMLHSDPDEVRILYEETGVDAIALSIGNAHGLYRGEVRLRFRLLDEARRLVPVPLVLHGGTGICAADFRRCIGHGVRKINIATASFLAAEEAARIYAGRPERDWFRLSAAMAEATRANVLAHVRIFGSEGRADALPTDGLVMKGGIA